MPTNWKERAAHLRLEGEMTTSGGQCAGAGGLPRGVHSSGEANHSFRCMNGGKGR